MRTHIWLSAACVAVSVACSGGSPSSAPGASGAPGAAGGGQINGAGATFPNPIYSKWFFEYNKAHPDVRINYQSLGSGAGIRQLTARTVFFGASDQPMKDEQLAAAPGKILHFPTVLGAVVPIYNLAGVAQPLKFTGPLLADVVLGKVKKWNDPAIADYLGKVSPEFKSTVGVDASLKWPVGVGGKGNEGVSGLVRQTPGSLGYVELVYAVQNKISVGTVQNDSGAFITPSVESVTAAAAGAAANMPADFRVSITNAPGADAYPVASFTWLLLYEDPEDKTQGRQMKEFLRWALTGGQKMAPELGYARLPQPVVDMELKALEQLKVQ